MDLLDILLVEDLVVDTMPPVLPQRLVVEAEVVLKVAMVLQRALLTLVLEVVVVHRITALDLPEDLVSALFVMLFNK
tara:strand:- start:41 stop:271 length:231 start_codon:yes stop_codon:yes gene_type:complete